MIGSMAAGQRAEARTKEVPLLQVWGICKSRL